MNHSSSLTALLTLAERERDVALAEQLRHQSMHASAKDKADQLMSYRREYELRWSEQFCREGNIELVRCYQGFMARLSQAVDEQVRKVELAADQLAQATATLRERDMRAAAVTKLLERREREERSGADRQEQRLNDDLSSRVAWDRLAAMRRPSVA